MVGFSVTGPMLKFKSKEEKTPKSLIISQSGPKKNPFKVRIGNKY